MDAPRLDSEMATVAGPSVTTADAVPLLRHPLPAALVASALAALVLASEPFGASALIAAFIAAVLVVLAVSDLERRVIPNRVVLPAIALTLLAHLVVDPSSSSRFFLAAICAGLAFLLPSMAGRSWMGMGDVKFIVLLGAGLGLDVVGAITIAFVVLFPFAVAMILRRGLAARKMAIPFGPFLAVGGLIMLIVPHLAAAA